jgi:hypothetical protein
LAIGGLVACKGPDRGSRGTCRIYRGTVGSGQVFCLGQQGISLITSGRLQ